MREVSTWSSSKQGCFTFRTAAACVLPSSSFGRADAELISAGARFKPVQFQRSINLLRPACMQLLSALPALRLGLHLAASSPPFASYQIPA